MANQAKSKFSQRIKELRKEKKITQKQLAENTGISYGSIIDYENNKSEPNAKNMAILENYFNVSGAYLRGETDKKRTQSDEEQIQSLVQSSKEELSGFLKRIQNAIQEVSDDELEFVDGLLMDFFWTLRKKDSTARYSTLLLMHLSAHISTMFFDFYMNFQKNSSKDESIDKTSEIILEYQKEALDYVKNFLIKQE